MSESTAITPAGGYPGRIKKYVEDLRDEMRLVTWPAWKQVRATTIVVIAAVFIFSFYFMVVDTIVGRAIDSVFTRFAGA